MILQCRCWSKDFHVINRMNLDKIKICKNCSREYKLNRLTNKWRVIQEGNIPIVTKKRIRNRSKKEAEP